MTNATASPIHYWAHFTYDTATQISGGQMRADGGDIRVADASCNPLSFWIQSGLNTASTDIWVDIPSLAPGTSNLHFIYGNAAATHTNQASDVFGSGIVSLYTFTEQSGTVVHDWVGGHDLNMSSTTWTTGFRSDLGAVTGFDAGRAYAADAGASLGTGDFTALAFFTPTSVSGTTQGIVGNYSNDGNNGWVLKLQGNAGSAMFLRNSGGNYCQDPEQGLYTVGEWQMITGRRISGGLSSLFRNDVKLGDMCGGDTRNVDGPGPFEIGRSYSGTYPLTGGSVSFIAIYTRALSDAEVAAAYGALAGSGAAAPGPAPTTVPALDARSLGILLALLAVAGAIVIRQR